ncbi:glycosyltransferase family 39 protein [Suttonella sp. R2A3]|uniref:glycosyltransferase family 39 protein n=1 Tax=Suttonella sp. R2A3 TaxID=2908648 RepID=UPI001F29EE92|nr:glycosyltransferase family 39 protein [Suttonella sp. R2A3]UJF24432.1 glycosyltransferase family 39 protein [Suttonella sp. R2A3]
MQKVNPKTFFWLMWLGFIVLWVVISELHRPGMDKYGDMVEGYAWGQVWVWGTFKHPPFLAWVAKLWFSVFPVETWSYYLLSYLNAGVGALGIVALGRLWLPPGLPARRKALFSLLVLLFALLGTPYSHLAAKYNADTILLSLWPWTAYAFFATLHSRTNRERWLFTLLLGVLGAVSMLAKYYSGILLASFFAISVLEPTYRRWYRSYSPYLAFIVFFLVLMPHIVWEWRNDFPFSEYLFTKIDDRVRLDKVLSFYLSSIYYWIFAWGAFYLLRRMIGQSTKQTIRWQIPWRALLLMIAMPAVITSLFHIFGRVYLTTHWAIPIWFALPIALAMWLLPSVPLNFSLAKLARCLALFAAVLFGVMTLYTLILSATGSAKYTMAREEMVAAIEARFHERYPDAELTWSGGTWQETASLAFFMDSHPRAVPGFPAGDAAQVNPEEGWRDGYGVVLCHTLDDDGNPVAARRRVLWCQYSVMHELIRAGYPIIKETIRYQAQGWRYLQKPELEVVVFWAPPQPDLLHKPLEEGEKPLSLEPVEQIKNQKVGMDEN